MERRRHSRFIIEGVACKVLSDSGVDIINISPQGIEIVSTVRLEMHREYTLRIDDTKKIIPLRGTVVWSVLAWQGRGPRGEQVPLYEAGLEFRNLNAAQLSDINAFISSHQISREQRAIARFEIKSPEKTTIHYPSHYPVRKISRQPAVPAAVHPSGDVDHHVPASAIMAPQDCADRTGSVAGAHAARRSARRERVLGGGRVGSRRAVRHRR